MEPRPALSDADRMFYIFILDGATKAFKYSMKYIASLILFYQRDDD